MAKEDTACLGLYGFTDYDFIFIRQSCDIYTVFNIIFNNTVFICIVIFGEACVVILTMLVSPFWRDLLSVDCHLHC